MKYVVTPDLCLPTKDGEKEVPAKFAGTVTLELPKYPVLCQIKREIALEMSRISAERGDEKDPEKIDKLKLAASNMDAEIFTFQKLEPMLVAVDMKHLETGTEAKDIETLCSHPLFAPVIGDLTMKLMTGFAAKN